MAAKKVKTADELAEAAEAKAKRKPIIAIRVERILRDLDKLSVTTIEDSALIDRVEQALVERVSATIKSLRDRAKPSHEFAV